MAKVCTLTTFDNPFDPFEEFEEWRRFDVEHHYNCCEYLDRIAMTSDQLSEDEYNEEIERAVDEIIKYDVTNLFRKFVQSENKND